MNKTLSHIKVKVHVCNAVEEVGTFTVDCPGIPVIGMLIDPKAGTSCKGDMAHGDLGVHVKEVLLNRRGEIHVFATNGFSGVGVD